METGIYYPLRFFEHKTGEPELSSNREECEGFYHVEYLYMPNDRILPFAVFIEQEEVSGVIDSITLTRIHCDGSEEEISISSNDWSLVPVTGGYLLEYLSFSVIAKQPNGQSRLRLEFTSPYIKKYYSDWFIFFKEAYVEPEITFDVKFHVTSDGVDIEGAEVTMAGKTKTTDSNGNVTFEDVEQGYYSYIVTKEGYADESGNTGFINEDKTIEVELIAGHELIVTVKDNETNETIEDATVEVSIYLGDKVADGKTDASGVIVFEHLESHDYTIKAWKAGYESKTVEESIQSDTSITISLVAEEEPSDTYDLTFIVQDQNNNPIENAEVYLQYEGIGTQYTDSNGEVTYTDVPEDTYNYSVSKDGYTDKAHEVTIDGSDKTENVTLEEKAELIFTLAVDLNPDVLSGDQHEQGGTVTYNNEEYFAYNTPISFDVFEGATIELMAMALGDYIFDGYYEGGEKIHASEGLSFEITEDRHITAKFIK